MVGKGNLREKERKRNNQKYVFDPVLGEKIDRLELNLDLANFSIPFTTWANSMEAEKDNLGP